jgi:hypothetical protein
MKGGEETYREERLRLALFMALERLLRVFV